MFLQTVGMYLYRDFISIARNVDLADIMHLEGVQSWEQSK